MLTKEVCLRCWECRSGELVYPDRNNNIRWKRWDKDRRLRFNKEWDDGNLRCPFGFGFYADTIKVPPEWCTRKFEHAVAAGMK